MARTKSTVVLWTLTALVVLVGCGSDPTSRATAASAGSDSAKLQVLVVNYPLQYFAERIGGDLVQVELPVPADVDPAFWRPDAAGVSAYQSADLVLLNGAGYAKWLNSVSLPTSTLVDTSSAFEARQIPIEEAPTHAHGPEGEHEHGGVAFTTWLDFDLALEQARAIEAAFRRALPAAGEQFGAALASLERDLLDLDRSLEQTVQGQALPLLGSHPVYQYLAQGYGLEIESVHFEPDEFPDESAWRDLEALLERHPARWMLWEGQPLARTASRLETLGITSVVFDPCGNRPDSSDFLTVQQSNLENLRRVFRVGA